MLTKSRLLIVLAVAIATALFVAACGGDSDSSSSSSSAIGDQFAAPVEAPDECQAGRRPDGARSFGRRLHRPGRDLLPVRLHGHQRDAVAAGRLRAGRHRRPSRCWPPSEPTVSDDGKTITYKLRDDVKFSPPVNRTVTAADVKYAIERALLPGVANGYAQTYLNGVVGFDDAVKQAQSDPTGGAPDISGHHDAPDDTTLVIKLDNTTSIGVQGALSLPISAPGAGGVREAVTTRRTRRPTATTRSPSGPYMIENDAQGDADRLHAEQGDPPRPQPQLEGLGRRTSGPLTWTTSRSRRASPTRSRRARRSSPASAMVNGDFTTPPSVDQAGRDLGRGGTAHADPERRQPLRRAQHDACPRSTTSTSARP